MSDALQIRRYRSGEEAALFEIYYSAIHFIASRDYTAEQIDTWAPFDLDPALWDSKMRIINSFIAELNGELVGYADVQVDGYIDHFFVSGKHPRRGIGSLLTQRLIEEAVSLGAPSLTSDVSRTAQPFFQRFWFVVVERRLPQLRRVEIPNALMRRSLNMRPNRSLEHARGE